MVKKNSFFDKKDVFYFKIKYISLRVLFLNKIYTEEDYFRTIVKTTYFTI